VSQRATEFFRELNELCKDLEMFVIEATPNDYTPAPPEGWFGMRSHKRRVFLPLVDGRHYPNRREMMAMIRVALHSPDNPNVFEIHSNQEAGTAAES